MSQTNKYLSVVVPVFQSEVGLYELIKRLKAVLFSISPDVELILVDDGSTDGSWELIAKAALEESFIKGIRFSRNFGQHHAIFAGLDMAQGEWVVVMDADLQDLPEEIPMMLTKVRYGYEAVLARRTGRKDSWASKILSTLYYRVFYLMSGIKQDPSIGNFGVYNRKIIDSILKMRENNWYFPTMVHWVGFNQSTFNVKHGVSTNKRSNYFFKSKFRLGLNTLLAFSDKPLRLTVKFGLLVAFIGFLFALITLIRYFSGAIEVPGYASMIVSLWILFGCLLTTIGIVGLYVGKTFEGVKKRPRYIIDQKT
ncbi:glycosyltransferase family 2 protein [Cyclobacterium amurskyense]|uniref:Glycosyl transferase family 2 n=1 Tax=Cyclobacterium amurskyense TaxID=320787 RepID=A0A0H4PJ11_9BACT|nr:glycosyltransferase family 2 protein [Cyclobacterium amurskyense]AKP53005.1 Glycosyl transferase family 2 [Cyclobacterium amurskyense]|tara:strand:- start:16843 stop:17772 length:930 start_codon:yes stop_codon:yes gene_type:complete